MTKAPVKQQNNNKFLRFLYYTVPGRTLLKGVSCPVVSKTVGAFLSSPLSHPVEKVFERHYGIDLSQYEDTKYRSFNDCFTRRMKPELRPVDMSESALIAPCDGLLSAYRIRDGIVIPAKQSRYTIEKLVGSREDAAQFCDGICLVFRLCVYHYHRYCFVDDGKVIKTRKIKGKLNTVRPLALETVPVFTENCREVSIIESENLGHMAQIEIGALLVGKISNHEHHGEAVRGKEKGLFLYGGSTIILLLEKNRAEIPEEYFRAADEGMEISFNMGETLGKITKNRE